MKRFKFLFPLLALLLLTTTQCTKESLNETPIIEAQEEFLIEDIQNPIIENFLTTSYLSSVNENVLPKLKSRSDEELINDVMETLNEQNKQHNFIEKLTKKYGYPIWDRSYIYPSNAGKDVLFTPLAFEDGNEITSFIMALPFKDSYHIELFTKKAIDKLIKNPKKEANHLLNSVVFCIKADTDIFDNPREEYIEWYEENKDNFVGNGSTATSRACTEISVCTIAFKGEEETASSRSSNCDYYTVCDTGSTDTGGGDTSCQECGDAGGTGSASGGGSSTDDSEETFSFANYSIKSFCFQQVGSGWTAVTTNINFNWRATAGYPSRTITVSITTVVPETRFNGVQISRIEAQRAATEALNTNHSTILSAYGLSRSWNTASSRTVANELAELMELELFARFGYASVSAGSNAPGVGSCPAQ